MQSVCLLFAGRRGLDDQGTRHSILRIPEVSRKLRAAQNIIDSSVKSPEPIDLYSLVLANNDEFNLNQNLKSLISSIVQVGLFDRYTKFCNRPLFLIGRTNGGSALKVCADQQSLEDLIFQSDYFNEAQITPAIPIHGTQLAGISLEEYGLYQWSQALGEYEAIEVESRDAVKIVSQLSQENLINQCIHVGPNYEFRHKEFDNVGEQQIPSMSSIDLDPILSSFWKSA